jgi:hypothetical protein
MEEYAWLVPTITRLVDLLRYPDRANEFGSRKVTSRAARAALLVLMRGVTDDAPAPRLVPTIEGGLRFEWLEYWVDVVFVVEPDGSVKASVTVPGNVPQTNEATGVENSAAILDVGLSQLTAAVKNPPPRPSGPAAAVQKS